jgi:hypothetical protein
VHCPGVDHLDFSSDGTFALASCEFSAELVRIDLRKQTVTGYMHVGGSPQDVKLPPDGRTFYVANRYPPQLARSSVQLIDAHTFRVVKSSPPRRQVATWRVPGTPAMGGVSPDGATPWVSGRYNGGVYAISTVEQAATRARFTITSAPGDGKSRGRATNFSGVSSVGTGSWRASRVSSLQLVPEGAVMLGGDGCVVEQSAVPLSAQ